MDAFSLSQSNDVKIGTYPGWAIEFYDVANETDPVKGITTRAPKGDPVATFRSGAYDAVVDATLNDGLTGGSYKITIVGLSDTDYALISQGKNPDRTYAKLYLYWHDAVTGATSYLANVAGLSDDLSAADLKPALVATLFVDSVKRSSGKLTYDTTIHGIEWAAHALSWSMDASLDVPDLRAAAKEIAARTKIAITTYPQNDEPMTAPPKEPAAASTGGDGAAAGAKTTDHEKENAKKSSYAKYLKDKGTAIEKSRQRFGRGMLLIRDGELHFGKRPYPLKGDPKDLIPSTGLVEVSLDAAGGGSSNGPASGGGAAKGGGAASAASAADEIAADDPAGKSGAEPEKRKNVTVTLLGRADLKPGDVVRLELPSEDAPTTASLGAALLEGLSASFLPFSGGLSATPTSLAVSTVRHQIGRDVGFTTTVTGVSFVPESPDKGEKDPGRGDGAWDKVSKDAPSDAKDSPKADPSLSVASAFGNIAKAIAEGLSPIEVAGVRSFTAKGDDPKVPSQTLTAWEGLVDKTDPNPNGTRRLPIDRKASVRADLPYASPFAWGKCGLVLPRYPGMRIVLAHRKGSDTEPIDVGAIWDSGQGPDSEPGDFWLSLPRGVDEVERSSAQDADELKPYTGPATHDLIDADGNRVVEVGSLTIRIGEGDKLSAAGTRPLKDDAANSVVIEHTAKGARIEIDQDGKITVSGTSIELKAPDGEINLTAKTVNVKVSGAMNVSDP